MCIRSRSEISVGFEGLFSLTPPTDLFETFKIMLYFRIVADNVDFSVKARIQTKEHSNQSIHWTHQYAVLDRVTSKGEDSKPKSALSDLQPSVLLPTQDVQNAIKEDCVILISRIITTYLKAFQHLRNVVVHHIPHKHSESMSQKSQIVSMSHLFWGRGVRRDN